MSLLDRINSPADLRGLTAEQDRQLCAEIREFLVSSVSKTGGHLASNLGIVELTIALHKVFDTEKDRILFDVGHQSYVHKMLTGRRDRFGSLRRFGGMAGFPKPNESVHDAFIAGHASNSVSAALGMARARSIKGEDYSVVAVLGDGALTGGLAYEGLSDAGESGEPLIVVLNDNGMSITENVGGMARYLAHLRLKPGYFRLKRGYHRFVEAVPGGRTLYKITHALKAWFKNATLGSNMFEEMGFTYLGPVDGHDIKRLKHLLEQARELKRPVLLHIITTKGKGYSYSEADPESFHGVSGFDVGSGKQQKSSAVSFSSAFGAAVSRMAVEDERVCAITAAMQQGTGLDGFALRFPGRFFDVGIAEGHAVTMAAGMASQGLIPVVAIYSSFLQRAYDMLIHDVAISSQHVVFAVDRAGLVGEDGETHHGVFDVGFLRQIPGMTIFCPASLAELEDMLRIAAYETEGPVAVRYPRGGEGIIRQSYASSRTTLLRSGTDVTIVCYGAYANIAADAAWELYKHGVSAEIIKLGVIKPIDMAPVFRSAEKTGAVIVAEDCVYEGSVGQEIAARLECQGICCPVTLLNIGRSFVPHGSVGELYKSCGIDRDSLISAAVELIKRRGGDGGEGGQ